MCSSDDAASFYPAVTIEVAVGVTEVQDSYFHVRVPDPWLRLWSLQGWVEPLLEAV